VTVEKIGVKTTGTEWVCIGTEGTNPDRDNVQIMVPAKYIDALILKLHIAQNLIESTLELDNWIGEPPERKAF
jgi:hypothetical protein